MEIQEIIQSPWFQSYGVAILICLARITDVTIGTIRIIFVSKGYKALAALLGFVEISIWLTAISQVMQNIDKWQNFVGFAIGYSAGNYLGIYVENLLAMGNVVVRIITKRNSDDLVTKLRGLEYSVTVTDAHSNEGEVSVIFTLTKRKKVQALISVINHYNPRAVYSVEDVRHVKDEEILNKQIDKSLHKTLKKGK